MNKKTIIWIGVYAAVAVTAYIIYRKVSTKKQIADLKNATLANPAVPPAPAVAAPAVEPSKPYVSTINTPAGSISTVPVNFAGPENYSR